MLPSAVVVADETRAIAVFNKQIDFQLNHKRPVNLLRELDGFPRLSSASM